MNGGNATGQTPGRKGEGGYFSAPLGSATDGRLLFARGASRLTIRADPAMENLYSTHFERPVPTVEVRGSNVTVLYPRFRPFDWPDYYRERPAEVALNASIVWQIELRGGASKLTADLRGLQLGSLNLSDGVSRIEVALPRPLGTVPVRILGGASNVTIRRPEGVPARVWVGSGATNLTFDEKHFGAVGGEVNLRSPDYDSASDRYDIAVTGGANNLTIEDARPGRPATAR